MNMRVRDDYRTLMGQEKAPIFLLSLSEERTSQLFGMMDDDEILELSQIMSSFGKIGPTVIERLFVDFSEQMSSTNTLVGSQDSTERMLLKSGLSQEKFDNIMEEIRGPAGRTMWEKLGNVNEEILASFLQKEYPQTVAVVLSKVTSDHAARVLAILPDGFALEVINRMLKMETVQKDILEEVEKTLRKEFMTNLSRTQRRDSHELMAEIFNNMERAVENRFMEDLEKGAPEAAEKIRSLMFTFDDLSTLDAASIQTVVRAIDKEKLPMALKGASDSLQELFFSNMSERAAKIMKEDMAAMGPVRLKDVEEAQQYIVTVTKDLEGRGEVVIASGTQDEEMVG